jgi:hypothetical protein
MPADAQPENRVPVFRSWRAWYALLLIALAAQLIFYYYLTQLFS